MTKVVPRRAGRKRMEHGNKLANKHPNAYATAKSMCRVTRYMKLWEAIKIGNGSHS